MGKLNQNEIRRKALEIIRATPGGIRYSMLVKKIQELSPETPENTIHGSVWDLQNRFPAEVVKPSRGLFTSIAQARAEFSVTNSLDQESEVETPAGKVKEADFYKPFAEYLKNDLNEVVVSVSLGRACMGKKWGTPDVVGVYKPSIRDMIKFDMEIVSAEIKLDAQQPAVAFGQAIAYRLFSSKSYVVVPTTSNEEDLTRLEALCMLFGVGMVLFKPDPDKLEFAIRVRAQRFFPDMFYVNEFADRLKDSDAHNFEKLFG